MKWATLFLIPPSFAPFFLPLSLRHTKVGFLNTTTEGSLFSGLFTNTTEAHNVHMCTFSRTSQHARVYTQTRTHIPGPVFWFPGCPIVPCHPLVNGPLCICVCVCACVCRLIRQPSWPHVTSSVSSPLTLLSTTDHPPPPPLLWGSVT